MTMSRARLNGLDLTTLRLLVAAQEEQNLARAAARENISVSAISRRISEFETRYGVQLLRRHDRGVAPTPDGSAVLPRIARALSLLEDIVDDLTELRSGRRGTIRVWIHPTALTDGLAQALGAFMAARPEIETTFMEATSRDIAHAVRVGLCDLGFISGTIDTEGLVSRPWGADVLSVAMPDGHPLTRFDAVPFEAVLDHPFIAMQKDSALLALFRAQAHLLGRSIDERAYSGSFETARFFVRNGFGVSILPTSTLDGSPALVARPLLDDWARRPLMMCVREVDPPSAATRALIDFLTARPPACDAS